MEGNKCMNKLEAITRPSRFEGPLTELRDLGCTELKDSVLCLVATQSRHLAARQFLDSVSMRLTKWTEAAEAGGANFDSG